MMFVVIALLSALAAAIVWLAYPTPPDHDLEIRFKR